MNNDKDYDRDNDREDRLDINDIGHILEDFEKNESEMMIRYTTTAERIHNNDNLRNRLLNFSEGNAKRAEQLKSEISDLDMNNI